MGAFMRFLSQGGVCCKNFLKKTGNPCRKFAKFKIFHFKIGLVAKMAFGRQYSARGPFRSRMLLIIFSKFMKKSPKNIPQNRRFCFVGWGGKKLGL